MARAHPDTGADAPRSADLGLALGHADGVGVITLAKRERFGWLGVEELTLEIPGLTQPPAPETPVARFQHRRTRVRSAHLQVSPQGLARLVALRSQALDALGVEHLTLQPRDGHVAVAGQVRVQAGAQAAEIGFCLYLVAAGATLRVLVGRPRVYGFLPEPAPRLAHRITAALLDAVDPAVGSPRAAGKARAQTADGEPAGEGAAALAPGAQAERVPPDRVVIDGLGRFAIEPLSALLWHLMPASGWRLPQSRQIGAIALGARRGGLHIGFGATGDGERAVLAEAEPAALVEGLDAIERADELLRAGADRQAVRVYRELLAGGGPEGLLCERILAVCAADPALFEEGRALAREHSERAALAPVALAALAAMAVGDRDPRTAATHFEHLADTAAATGDVDTSLSAALAAARLVRAHDPAAATRLYERIARRRPDHAEAVDALVERYTESQRWSDLVNLLRRRIEAAAEPGHAGQAGPAAQPGPAQTGQADQLGRRVQLARVLFQRAGEPAAAREELDAIRRIDPVYIPALEALIDLELATGNRPAALERLGHVANLSLRQGDEAAAARAFARAGALWALAGEHEEADAAYREALSLVADDPEALRGAAAVAGERGLHEVAVTLWSQLDALGGHAPGDQARHRLGLGRSLLATGDTEAAARSLREATYHGSDGVAAEAHALLADVHRAQHELDSAVTDLGAAITALSRAADTYFAQHPDGSAVDEAGDAGVWPPDEGELTGSRYLTRAAHLAYERARLLDELGRGDEARVDYDRAHALARKVDAVGARTLARSFLQAGRARGDVGAQRRWIDTLLDDGAAGGERVDLLLSRVELRRHATRSQPADAAGSDGADAFATGDAAAREAELRASLADIDEALAGEPSQVQRALALVLRADLLGASGNALGRAQALAERATLVIPPEERAQAEVEAAQAWLDAGDPQSAMQSAENAFDVLAGHVAPDAPAVRQLRLILGEAAWRRRAWPVVMDVYEPLVTLARTALESGADPDPAMPLGVWAHRLGCACEAEGEYRDAIRAFETASHAPVATMLQRLESHRALARAYENAGASEQAARTFEALARELSANLDADPREAADAWSRAGDLWRRHGDAQEAERCFEAALHLAEDHLPTLDALEALERDQGDHEQVAVVLSRKLAVASGYPQRQKALLLRLAALHAEQLGRADLALESYRRVLEIDPDCRPALAFVATHERAEGRVEAATAMYEHLAGVLSGEDEPPRGAMPATDRPAPPSSVMEQRVRAAETMVDLVVASKDVSQRQRARAVVENLAELLPRHPALRALRQRLADAALPPIALKTPARAAESVAPGATAGATAGATTGAPAGADVPPAPAEIPPPGPAEMPPAPDEIPQRAPDEIPQRAPDEVPQRTPDEIPQQAPDEVPQRTPDEIPQRTPGEIPQRAPDEEPAPEPDEVPAPAPAEKPAPEPDEVPAPAPDEVPATPEEDEASLRERADTAAASGDLQTYAACLRALASRIPADGPSRHRIRRAEVLLELADLYYDQLGDRASARKAMREAADAYGSGSRRDATLRMLASEAMAEQADEEAVAAYEAIAPGRRTVADRSNLAAAYHRLGSNHAAMGLLEDLERAGVLSDEGAVMLFGLRQERKARGERASRGQPAAVSMESAHLAEAEAAGLTASLDDISDETSDDTGRESGDMPDAVFEESLDRAFAPEPDGDEFSLEMGPEQGRAVDTAPGMRVEHMLPDATPLELPSVAMPPLELPQPSMSSFGPPSVSLPAIGLPPVNLPPLMLLPDGPGQDDASASGVPQEPGDDVDTSPVDALTRRRRRARKAFAETRLGVPPATGAAFDPGISLPPIQPIVQSPVQSPVQPIVPSPPIVPSMPLGASPVPPAAQPPVTDEVRRIGSADTDPAVIQLTRPAAGRSAEGSGPRAGDMVTTMPFGTPAGPPPGEPVEPSLPRRPRTPTGKRRRAGRITEPGMVTPPARKSSRATITYPGVELDIRKLENAAISTQDPARAAELLTQSLTLRTGRLVRHGDPLDDDARAVLSRLRDVARRSRKYRLLVHGLEAAATVTGEPETSASLLREAAGILINQLGDEIHGVRLLIRALEATPADAGLMSEIASRLGSSGDIHRLIDAYQLHLGAVDGAARARPLYELGCLYRDVLDDAPRSSAHFARAHEADPDLAEVWLPLANVRLADGDTQGAAQLYDLVLDRGSPDPETREWILSRLSAIGALALEPASPTQPDRPSNRRRGPTIFHAAGGASRSPSRIEESLRRAATLEARGRPDAALVHYRVAAEDDPTDQRPLDALERLHQHRGDMEAYADLLADLLEVTPDTKPRARLLWRRGRVYRDHLQREADAYRCLKQAHATDPDDGVIAHDLRRLAMDRGEWLMAAELLRREIAAAPTTEAAGQLEMELAVLYDEKLLDADRARVHYEQALALDPALPGAPRPLARLYELAGRHADAARMNELAAQHARDDSQRSRLLYRAAVSAERANDVGSARRLYHLAALAAPEGDDAGASHRALLRLDDHSESAKLDLLELELRGSQGDEQRIDILRQLLAKATHTGNRDAADRHARALLNMDGADLSAYLVLKSRAEATQDWSALSSLLNARAVSLKERNERAAVYYDLGRLYQTRLEDPGAAAKSFERALAADPAHPAALEALAELAYDQQDWERARQLYARIRPETCAMPAEEIAYRRGVIAETLGYQREALESYARAVTLLPTHREALHALLRLSLEGGDLGRAIDASRALIELMPADDVAAICQARLRLAELCERVGDVDAAIEYAEMVVSEEPGSQAALDTLARLHEQRGDYESVVRALRRLIGLAATPQQRAALLYRLGEIQREQLGDPEQAADAYLKSIDLDPNHVPTLRRLLDHYWREADLSELLEIALALADQAALVDEHTGFESLGHVLIAAALRGDERLIRQIAAWLGARLPDVLVSALTETASHPAHPLDTAALARVVVEMQTYAPSLSRPGLIERLAANPATRPLADALRAAPK